MKKKKAKKKTTKLKSKKKVKSSKPKVKKAVKKKVPKKKLARSAKPKMAVIPPPNSLLVGRVEDYFAKIGVMAFTLRAPLSTASHIHILGHTTNLEQSVDSMQIDHQPVADAKAKAAVGIKVTARVRRGDYVFLIKE